MKAKHILRNYQLTKVIDRWIVAVTEHKLCKNLTMT